jgi:hypothetical protein
MSLPPEQPPPVGVPSIALRVLDDAMKRVPATRYALAVAGVAAAASIVSFFFRGRVLQAALALAGTFVFMVIMFLFSRLVRSRSRAVHLAALSFLWTVLALFIGSSICCALSLFIGVPLDWRPRSSGDQLASTPGETLTRHPESDAAAVAQPNGTIAVPSHAPTALPTGSPSRRQLHQDVETGTVEATDHARVSIGKVKAPKGTDRLRQKVRTGDVRAERSQIEIGTVDLTPAHR